MDALPASPPASLPASTPASTEDSTSTLLRRLWREHVRHHRGRLGWIVVLTAVMAGLTALYPIIIGRAFTLFEVRDQRILYQIPILVVVVTAAKAAAQYGQNVLVQQVVLLVIRELQGRLFAHLSHADLAQVEREAPAALATRFTTDATLIREALTRAVNGLKDGVTVLGLVVSMLYLDWVLSAIAAALYPLAALPIQRLGKRIRRASGGMQERTGETAALLHESFAQARTVRAYRLEAAEGARADAAFATLYRALMRMTRSRARVDPLAGGAGRHRHRRGDRLRRLALGGGRRRRRRRLHGLRRLPADGVAAAAGAGLAERRLAGRACPACPACSACWTSRRRSSTGPARRRLPPGRGEVRFVGVGFAYPDGRMGLDGLSFTAAPGLTVALVGPSGAGKSTALAMIPRLQDALAGAVLVDGADVRAVSLGSLRDAIAYVGQDALLFDDTVAANIRMGRPGATDAEVEAAALAAAADFVDALPEGYQTRVGPGGGRLSGGQRQRITLARALLRNPRILLLDEATSALDAESEAAVQRGLARLRQGRTTIVVAHRLSTVRDADLVVAMADGHAVEQGTHAELMDQGGLYARLVRTQALAA